jgi:SAM-dependent methyltransferase
MRDRESKEFYDAQYRGGQYASVSSPEQHGFFHTLTSLLSRYGRMSGRWLEVGCGRGYLQDVVDDYTGVDLSEAVAHFFHKPFYNAPSERLPFADNTFDGCWSYAVLEHVEDPEESLAEMRRVIKSGGILFLAPAWQCRPWAGQNYAWKEFGELSWLDRIKKSSIPIRNSVAFRLCFVIPRRIYRMMKYCLTERPIHFCSCQIEPNYTEYRVTDADARHHMDPFDAILWFRSRGDRLLSHPDWLSAFRVRAGTLVVKVIKS